MPSTKFSFSTTGMPEVLGALSALSTAHSEFTEKYIANEIAITNTVNTQIAERISAYNLLHNKLQAINTSIGKSSIASLKKTIDEESNILKNQAKEKIKLEEETERKRKELYFGKGILTYGGVGPTGGFGGVMAGGLAGAGMAVGTALISGIVEAMKQGIQSALEFGKEQLQQHFEENHIMSSIMATRQPGSNISRSFLENTANLESNRTGVSRTDMLNSMKVFQKSGGTISAEAAKNLATEHMLDPTQDISSQAQGLAGFYKANPSNYYEHYITAKAAASFGGISIEEAQQSIIKLAGLETARGMNKGNKSATLDESSRLIQIMSYGGLSAPQAETGINRFLIDRDKAKKLYGQSIQQALEEADKEINWKTDNRELAYQIEDLKREPGKAAIAAYHEAVNDLSNDNAQHLIHNDYNPQKWQAENVDEVSNDKMHKAEMALTSIKNMIYVLASPAITEAADYITSHKEQIEELFKNLVGAFNALVSRTVKNPNIAKSEGIYMVEKPILGELRAWWDSSTNKFDASEEIYKHHGTPLIYTWLGIPNPSESSESSESSQPSQTLSPQISNINTATQTTSVINAGVIIDNSKTVR